MVDEVREIALKALYKINEEGAYSNIALDKIINDNIKKIEQRDIGFISEIVYGTVTWRLTIDEIIKKYSKIRIKKISSWILNILRMSVYQIVFLDKVPKSAAVNEGVNLAKRYGHRGSVNFVNAVLRKVSKKDYEEFFEIENQKERLSKTTSMPMWIIDKLLEENDFALVEKICKNSLIKPKTSIRVNRLKISKEDLEDNLRELGIEFEQGYLDDFLVIDKIRNIENLPIFKNGSFTVQDEGAGLIPLVLAPKKGDVVLDACSSPGGKTTYLAEIMQNVGEIDAWDLHEHRTKLVKNTAKRLGLTIINTETKDASVYDESLKEKYDKILLDVPCLGLGVLKRKPDIKWERKEEDIKEISQIQEKILDTCSKYLKPNGELVYSTCSILKDENENIIEKFLEKNKNFTYCNIEEKIVEKNKKIKENNKKTGIIKFFQDEGNDGFFICKLIKK